jgi:hypothetical protein
MSAPHHGRCDWCRDPLGDVADEFNGGIGHPECAAWVCEQLAGPDAMPMLPPRRFYRDRVDPIIPFLERLGRESVRLGLDPQKIAAAVSRARR